MYLYVYDEAVQDRRYEREVSLIETRLTDLGIAGKIARLALFRDADELIRDEVRRGATTVVAVGNDTTLRNVLDAVHDAKVTVGIIPLGPNNHIADMLGVPTGLLACDVLSARLVEELDSGSINGMRFLHLVTAAHVMPTCKLSDGFSLTPVRPSTFQIRNLAQSEDFGTADPTDGKLELVLTTPERKLLKKTDHVTRLAFTQLALEAPNPMTLEVDGEEVKGSTFDIRVLPKTIRIISGKERKYV